MNATTTTSQTIAGLLPPAGAVETVPPRSAAEPRRADALVGVADVETRCQIIAMLRGLGFHVTAEADGFRLIERLADAILGKPVERPAVIIADAVLPGCTGLSLLSGLRDLGWNTPVILLSSRARQFARRLASGRNISDLFAGPFDVRALNEFIINHVLQHQGSAFDERFAS